MSFVKSRFEINLGVKIFKESTSVHFKQSMIQIFKIPAFAGMTNVFLRRIWNIRNHNNEPDSNK